MRTLHTPVQIITHDGALIIAAGLADPEIVARLPKDYLTQADALCKKVTADVSSQKTAKGELGNLTAAQTLSLKQMHRIMGQASKTARLAFFGQDVKLHQEFQVGADKKDLASFLSCVDVVLGSLGNAANLAAFKAKGWTDEETTALQSARDDFGPAEQYRVQSIAGAKDTTASKNTDATTLYENILTIQNAADLKYPTDNPANAGTRDKFLLNTFPPDRGGNHHDQPAPTPTPNPPGT